jgi:hypothetical protein
MKLLSEYLAQWDWYAKRREEAKIPIQEKWEKMSPTGRKCYWPWNFHPDAPREANCRSLKEVAVEIWH